MLIHSQTCEFYTYWWCWCLAFLFLSSTGTSGVFGTSRASLTFPQLLAHHWQPVHSSGRAVLLVGLSGWSRIVVLCVAACLCWALLSWAANTREGPAPLGCRREFSNAVALLSDLTVRRRAVTGFQPAFGPSFCGGRAACRALGRLAQHPMGRRASLFRTSAAWGQPLFDSGRSSVANSCSFSVLWAVGCSGAGRKGQGGSTGSTGCRLRWGYATKAHSPLGLGRGCLSWNGRPLTAE